MRKVLFTVYLFLTIFLTTEIFGVIRYFYLYGKFFYGSAALPMQPGMELPDKLSQAKTTYFKFNPYFGFMLEPGLSLRSYLKPERVKVLYELDTEPSWLDVKTNNYGFFSEIDFPFVKKNEKQVLIGIFGGSVAHWFYLQGKQKLIEILSSDSRFAGKEIVLLNFSAGGYKQPQQLLILNYFLSIGQQFDFIINIDGFNEIALADKNFQAGASVFMPSIQHLAPMSALLKQTAIDKQYIYSLSSLLEHKDLATSFKAQSQTTGSASAFLFYDLLATYSEGQYNEDKLAMDALISQQATSNDDSMIWYLKQPPSDQFTKFQIDITAAWINGSVGMQHALVGSKARYLHILQPNQYVSNKMFSEQELSLAKVDSPYREQSIKEGYNEFKQAANILTQSGIDFADATGIFDNQSSLTFSDNCCHLNQQGNEIFAQFVAEHLLKDNPN